VVESAAAQVVTKGTVSLAFAGTGKGLTLALRLASCNKNQTAKNEGRKPSRGLRA